MNKDTSSISGAGARQREMQAESESNAASVKWLDCDAGINERDVERVAQTLLERRGFGFYTDPMEGGQDAYDITCEALDEACAALAALAAIARSADKPVAWQWRVRSANGCYAWKDGKVPQRALGVNLRNCEERPLFAVLSSQIAKVRELRDKWTLEQSKFPNSFVYRDYINAANEIIKILEGGE